jgi:hypothetical protein
MHQDCRRGIEACQITIATDGVAITPVDSKLAPTQDMAASFWVFDRPVMNDDPSFYENHPMGATAVATIAHRLNEENGRLNEILVLLGPRENLFRITVDVSVADELLSMVRRYFEVPRVASRGLRIALRTLNGSCYLPFSRTLNGPQDLRAFSAKRQLDESVFDRYIGPLGSETLEVPLSIAIRTPTFILSQVIRPVNLLLVLSLTFSYVRNREMKRGRI